MVVVVAVVYLSVNLQAWKRSNSTRLPQVLNLTTSKTKQVYETSSISTLAASKTTQNSARLPHFSQLTTSKTQQFCETCFEYGNFSADADGLVPMLLAIFPLHLSKVLRLPRKGDARSYEVQHLSRKIILANLKISCSKMQPISGNQRPDLLTSLMNMSLVLPLPRDMHLCRSSSNVPRLRTLLKLLQNSHNLLTFGKVYGIPCACQAKPHRATTVCSFSISQLPKVLGTWCLL